MKNKTDQSSVLHKDKAALLSSSEWLLLLFLFLLSLILRLRYLGHLVAFDEAQNLLTLKNFLLHARLDKNFFLHPPLYLTVSAISAAVFGLKESVIELVSLFFSLLSLLCLYLLTKELFGQKTAFWATIVFVLSPLEMLISTLVKHDTLLLFLLLACFLFFFKKNYLASGLFLGLAFLTKELAVLGAVLIFLLWRMLRLEKKVLWQIFGLALFISGWWYVFFSQVSQSTLDMFFGLTPVYGQTWHEPFYFYLYKLPLDLSFPTFIFLLVGSGVYLFVGWDKREELFPLISAALIIGFFSLSYGKPYWMIYIALPSLSMLTGVGIDFSLKRLSSFPRSIRQTALFLVLACLVGWMIGKTWGLSQEKLAYREQYILASAAPDAPLSPVTHTPITDQQKAGLFLRSVLRPEDRIGIVLNEPITTWYSGIDPAKVKPVLSRSSSDLSKWVGGHDIEYLIFYAPHFDQATYRAISQEKRWDVYQFGKVSVLKVIAE